MNRLSSLPVSLLVAVALLLATGCTAEGRIVQVSYVGTNQVDASKKEWLRVQYSDFRATDGDTGRSQGVKPGLDVLRGSV